MNNQKDSLNEEQSESPFIQPEKEHEFAVKAGLLNHSVTGGKGPGFVSESEIE